MLIFRAVYAAMAQLPNPYSKIARIFDISVVYKNRSEICFRKTIANQNERLERALMHLFNLKESRNLKSEIENKSNFQLGIRRIGHFILHDLIRNKPKITYIATPTLAGIENHLDAAVTDENL